MNLYIVKNGSNPLFGREWLKSISINKKNSVSNVVTDSKTLPTVVHKKIKLLREEFSSVFEDELGLMKNITANLNLKPLTTPIYCKARTVPYANKPIIERELERLEMKGIITKIEYSDWATPILFPL